MIETRPVAEPLPVPWLACGFVSEVQIAHLVRAEGAVYLNNPLEVDQVAVEQPGVRVAGDAIGVG